MFAITPSRFKVSASQFYDTIIRLGANVCLCLPVNSSQPKRTLLHGLAHCCSRWRVGKRHVSDCVFLFPLDFTILLFVDDPDVLVEKIFYRDEKPNQSKPMPR